MTQFMSVRGCSAVLVTACLMVAIAADGADPYPKMAAAGQFTMARTEEIALARSAAPASVAEHAEVLVLGPHGYETAVNGSNGFVCFVGRSWDVAFDNAEFWNPKIRSPQCFNQASVRSVLPRYLDRTKWVLAGVSKADMQARETEEWKAGTLKAPEPGAMALMMSKGGYLNDATGGPWHPHFMLFVPRTDASQWGAGMPGSPIASDSVNYEKTTIIMVVVPSWSDGTPGPEMHMQH
jgi:hypothetical protein